MIGIFDSGIGGLSVFREIRKILPEEKYIYFSDDAYCPYGEKSREFIAERAFEIAHLLISKGADIIVIACNTATAAAIKTLRAAYSVHNSQVMEWTQGRRDSIRFIGMEPAVKPAAAITKTGTVGVLATAGTLKADKYLDTRERYSENIQVIEHVGEGFVELVESGDVTGPHAESVVQASLKPLLDKGADTIVLGCTHYPFLSETIEKVSHRLLNMAADGSGTEADPQTGVRKINIINPAPAVARHLHEVMEAEGLIRKEGFSIDLISSADTERLKEISQLYI